MSVQTAMEPSEMCYAFEVSSDAKLTEEQKTLSVGDYILTALSSTTVGVGRIIRTTSGGGCFIECTTDGISWMTRGTKLYGLTKVTQWEYAKTIGIFARRAKLPSDILKRMQDSAREISHLNKMITERNWCPECQGILMLDVKKESMHRALVSENNEYSLTVKGVDELGSRILKMKLHCANCDYEKELDPKFRVTVD